MSCSFLFSLGLFLPFWDSGAMSTWYIDRGLLISLDVLFDNAAFPSKINSLQLSVKKYLELVATAAVPAGTETINSMDVRASRTRFGPKKSQFCTKENMVLSELGAEYIWYVLRASPAVHTHAVKYSRIWEFFFQHLCERNVSVTLRNCALSI